jgi:hypothetical protein
MHPPELLDSLLVLLCIFLAELDRISGFVIAVTGSQSEELEFVGEES